MTAVTICNDFGAQKIKSVTLFTVSPSISHEVMGPGIMILIFWILSFKPTFSLSSFTFIKRLFSSVSAFCHKGGIICISEVIDISPSNLDSSLCFIQPSILHVVLCIKVKQAGWQHTALMHSFPNLEPVCCSMSCSNCCFLTCIQISKEVGQVVWYSHVFKNFPQFFMIHTVKGFGIVNKADVFLELSCFFDDPTDVGNMISVSSAFSKSCLNIWKFTFHVLLNPGLENFEHYFASVWDECNCAVVWASFGIAFLWDWNENWTFLVLWPLLSFPNLLEYWVQHFQSIIS